MNTCIIRPCGIDGCTNLVQWVFERGESPTWEHPGTPDYWIAESGCDEVKTIEVKYVDDVLPSNTYDASHLELITDDDDEQVKTDRIACEAFDNNLWEF